jgi:hypothetical protein
MSKIGWRWWDLGKDGSLQSVNHVLWPPNEPLQAECGFTGLPSPYLRSGHKRTLVDVRTGERTDVSTGGLADGLAHGMMLTRDIRVEVEPVPAYNCGCGYWAFWDPELASGLPKVSMYHRMTKVFGCIEAWGNIVEHELGFRAEWCIPRAVYVVRGRLHDAYEVDRYRNIEDMIKVWDDGGASEASGEPVQ